MQAQENIKPRENNNGASSAPLNGNLICTPESLKRWARPNLTSSCSPIEVLDLFCGCGGLSFGALMAGLQHNRGINFKLAIDFNRPALSVYKSNFHDHAKSIEELDIEKIVTLSSKSKTPTTKEEQYWPIIGQVDLIVAGPPCQGHSDLNNRSRRSDPRNSLYLAPARAAVNLRPKAVIIENVPTVTRSKEDVVGQSRSMLMRMGYHVNEILIDFTRLGVPQSRTRHVQIASIKPISSLLDSIKNLPIPPISCYDYISDIEDEAKVDGDAFNKTTKLSSENIDRINHLFNKNIFDLPDSFRPTCHRDKVHSYLSMYGRLNPNKPAQTITSGFGSMGQGRFVHPTKPRMITAHEAARLQGFPDAFDFGECKHVTGLREMIGNAVPPPLTQFLVGLLIEGGHL